VAPDEDTRRARTAPARARGVRAARDRRAVAGERRLLVAAQRGDRAARRRLVAANASLVKGVACRYVGLGLTLDDVVQEGSLGLVDAIERYDPRRGADFRTYARFRVRSAIRNALTADARLVRLPKQTVERRRAVAHAEERLTAAAHGRPPTTDELAADTGLPSAAVADVRRADISPVSLDEPVTVGGPTLKSLLVDASAPDPELEAVSREEERLVRDAVGELSERKREVVKRRFGFGRAAKPVVEVAEELRLSPQRTRTIERDALYDLRTRLERAGFEP
jgi:RNA polymerase primary sigma factor